MDASIATTVFKESPVPANATTTVSLHTGRNGPTGLQRMSLGPAQRFDSIVIGIQRQEAGIVRSYPMPFSSLSNVHRRVRSALRDIYLTTASPHRPTRPFFDTRAIEPNNIAHVLLDLLPYCMHVRHVVGPTVEFVFRPLKEPFESLIRHFDIEPRQHRGRIVGDMIQVRGLRGLSAHPVLAAHDVSGIDFFPDTYTSPSPVPNQRDLFLCRRDSRSLTNVDAVCALVKTFGYEVVYMEDHSIREQVEIGRTARHVVAVHGAAMSYLALSPHIQSIVELFPPNVWHDYFPVRLGKRVGQYHQILPRFEPSAMFAPWQQVLAWKSQPFAIDPGDLEGVLSGVHDRPIATSQAA